MINQEKFLSYIEYLYRTSGNDAVRTSTSNQTIHSINIENFNFVSVHVKANLLPETFIIDIKNNKRIEYLPTFYSDSSDLAKNLFYHLESVSEQMKKTIPLSTNHKLNLVEIINKNKQNITFKHLDMGSDFINQCKIVSEKLNISAYEEFNSCYKNYIYRVSVKNSDNNIAFPTNYNSVNSNDYKFAYQIFNQMRSYVR